MNENKSNFAEEEKERKIKKEIRSLRSDYKDIDGEKE